MPVRLLASIALFSLVPALASGLPSLASAENGPAGQVRVTQPWARASVGKIAAAYVTIEVSGKEGASDRLVAVSSPDAARVEIHTHQIDKRGVARMRPVAGLAIRAGAPTVFKPGGLHLMLFGLKAPLKKGGKVPLVFHFQRAGKIRVMATIRGYGARWHGGKGG